MSKDPIRDAAEAVQEYVSDSFAIPQDLTDEIADIIRAKLREAVPVRTAMGLATRGFDLAQAKMEAYNDILKALGLGGE